MATIGEILNDSVLKEREFWNVLFGSCLGASFYLLLRNYKLLIERTYNPRYDKANIVRLTIGVVSGAILPQLLVAAGQPMGSLYPGLVAILGGFSAEAVEAILQRLVEVMLAAVRGDNSAKIEADMREYKAKLSEEQSKRNSAARDKLASAKAEPDLEKRQAMIDEALSVLK
ncbi:MAG: hypothetical protein ABL974_06820 [Prosthecobacter sp.]